MLKILVGTEDGLHELGGGVPPSPPESGGGVPPSPPALGGHVVTALAVRNGQRWVILDGETVLRAGEAGWEEVAHLDRLRARCLLPVGDRLLIGTSEAHLFDATAKVLVSSFDRIETRSQWYTPWGGPPDTRSLSLSPKGSILANVHVGGVWRAADPDADWHEVVAVDADTHEVRADPQTGTVAVAAAIGFGQSRDDGETWEWTTDGLHGTYCRAVAFASSTVFVTASTGPFSKQAAVYRRPLDHTGPFERCQDGLPEWFASNVDTGCLAAAGVTVVLGTGEGEMYLSQDEGRSWELLARDLPPVHAVALT